MKPSIKSDTELDPIIVKKFKKSEIPVRIIGILTIAFIYSFDRQYIQFGTGTFWWLFLINICFTATMWNGSMAIIHLGVSRVAVFEKPLKLILVQTILLTILVLVVEITFTYISDRITHTPTPVSELRTNIVIAWLITFLISFIYASVGFFIQWKENLLKAQRLEKANIEAQYETLKNQVNPHFLFNSLNTLLTMVSNNPEASKYVESLSDFMRYVLQNRSKEAVLLRDELTMAREYIFLQKSRFGEKLIVNFDVPESCFHFAVPPLSLQMLLENAIKHNTISKENPLKIDVYISASNFIVIENSLRDKIDKEESTGIGLANIKNRYLYLTGKEIKIENDNVKFRVSLPLVEVKL